MYSRAVFVMGVNDCERSIVRRGRDSISPSCPAEYNLKRREQSVMEPRDIRDTGDTRDTWETRHTRPLAFDACVHIIFPFQIDVLKRERPVIPVC